MMPYSVAIVSLGLMLAFAFPDKSWIVWPCLTAVGLAAILNAGWN